MRIVAIAFVPAMFFDWVRLTDFTLADNPTSILGLLLALAFLSSRRHVASAFRIPAVLGVLYLAGIAVAFLLAEGSFGSGWAAQEFPRWFQFAQAGFLFVILVTVLRDEKALRWVVLAFFLSAVALSVAAHLGIGVEEAQYREFMRTGIRGINLNQQAFMYGLALIGVAYWAMFRWPRFGWRGLAVLAGAVSILVAFVKTGSRGGVAMVVVGLAAGAVLLLRGRRLRQYLVAVPIIMGGMLWYITTAPVVQKRFQEALEGRTGMRVELTQSAWAMVQERPLAGWGAGYAEALGEYVGVRRAIAAHNTYLQVLVAFGVIGFIPWLAMVGLPGWRLWRHRRHPMAAAVLALFIAALAFAAVGNEAYGKAFAILLAMVAVLPEHVRRSSMRGVLLGHPRVPGLAGGRALVAPAE